MACGRVLLDHHDGHSIGKALLILSQTVKKLKPAYDINIAHNEILLDLDDAEANAFQDGFGKTIFNIIRPGMLCIFYSFCNASSKTS